MRIAGLASGMDIDSIVKNLMKAESLPLEKLKQKKQILEWQRDDYREINTKLLNFRDKLSQLRLTHNYRARTVASSNDAFVSATVTSGASQASYSISKVEQLATAATLVNGGSISTAGQKIDPTKSLSSQKDIFRYGNGFSWNQGVLQTQTFNVSDPEQPLQLAFEGQLNEEINIRVNGQALKATVVETVPADLGENEVVVSKIDGTLHFGKALAKDSVVRVDYVIDKKEVEYSYEGDEENPLKSWNIGAGSIATATININGVDYSVDATNADEEGNVQLGSYGHFNVNTGTISFNDLTENVTVNATYTQSYASIDLNTHTSKGEVHETILFTGNDSLNTVIRKVNESSAGVTMFYDSFSDQVTLTRKETGDFNKNGKEINVSGDFIINTLRFRQSTETGGQNAKFTVNGLTTERNSNTFDMSGVTITLKQVFDSETDNVQPVSVTIGNDTDQVVENIKEFVNQYNELIKEIREKLNEPVYRDYKPLTDDEREELSEKQQEKWEEMARSGLLKGDAVLSSVLSSMRTDMYSTVETNGIFKHLSSIGIRTTANYMEGGILEINEAKLKEALEQDPDAVENLFRGSGTEAGTGIIHRLYDTVNNAMERIRERAGRATSTNQQFSIGRELISVDNSIDRFEDRLKQVENRYWRQFTAMEKAIQRANQQSMYLMQQFSF